MSQSHVKMAVDVDQSAELWCSARGWPTPGVTWSRENATSVNGFSKKTITASYDVDEQFPVTSVLNISSVEQDDLGVYTCTAHNDMGVDVTQFHLTVKSKPRQHQAVKFDLQPIWQVPETGQKKS